MFYDFTNHICIMLVSRQPLYGNNLVNYGNQENIQSKPGNKKSSWLLVGYVIVLVFMFVAFEWSKRDVRIDMSGAITENDLSRKLKFLSRSNPN